MITIKLRCPRCYSRSFQLVETVEILQVYSVIGGTIEPNERSEEYLGCQKVEGSCVCGHKWRLRGVVSIDGIKEVT